MNFFTYVVYTAIHIVVHYMYVRVDMTYYVHTTTIPIEVSFKLSHVILVCQKKQNFLLKIRHAQRSIFIAYILVGLFMSFNMYIWHKSHSTVIPKSWYICIEGLDNVLQFNYWLRHRVTILNCSIKYILFETTIIFIVTNG